MGIARIRKRGGRRQRLASETESEYLMISSLLYLADLFSLYFQRFRHRPVAGGRWQVEHHECRGKRTSFDLPPRDSWTLHLLDNAPAFMVMEGAGAVTRCADRARAERARGALWVMLAAARRVVGNIVCVCVCLCVLLGSSVYAVVKVCKEVQADL